MQSVRTGFLLLVFLLLTPLSAFGQKDITGITITQASTQDLGTRPSGFGGSTGHAILRVQFTVASSGGSMDLQSVTVTARNSDTTNDDVAAVRIFHHASGNFAAASDVTSGGPYTFPSGAGQSVTVNITTNMELSNGSVIWVVYDLANGASVANGNVVDATLGAGSIATEDAQTWPLRAADPPGARKVFIPNYWVNDGSTSGDLLCTTGGNDAAGNGQAPNAPKLTLQSLLSDVNYNLTAGDIVYVEVGAYEVNSTITFTTTDDGNTGPHLIVRGAVDQLNGSKLSDFHDLASTVSGNIFHMNGADFVELRDLVIRNARPVVSGTDGNGVFADNGSNDLRIVNCDIHSNDLNGVSLRNATQLAANHEVLNNRIHDNGTNAAGGHGVIILLLTGCRVADNTIFNNGNASGGAGDGVRAEDNCTGTVVERNVVHDNDRHGIVIFGQNNACSNSRVTGNTVYGHDDEASNVGIWVLRGSSNNVQVSNNIVFENIWGIRWGLDGDATPPTNAVCNNNTVHARVNGSATTRYGITFEDGCSGWTLKNNIILADHVSGTGNAFGLHLLNNTERSGSTSDYNNLFGLGTNGFFAHENGTNYTVLVGGGGTWRGDTPFDDNSISSNPEFVDFTNGTFASRNYHLHSQHGRFDPGTGLFTYPTSGTPSPSIDAGDTSDPFDLEPENNGNRVNQGAYGNTRQASKSTNSVPSMDFADDVGFATTNATALNGTEGLMPSDVSVQLDVGNANGDRAQSYLLYTNNGANPDPYGSPPVGTRTRPLSGLGNNVTAIIPAFAVGTTVKFIVMLDGKPFYRTGTTPWSYDVQDTDESGGAKDDIPGVANRLALFDNALFTTQTPKVRFRAFDPEGNTIHYQVEWANNPGFSGSTTQDSINNPGSFANLDGGGPAYPSGDRVEFTFPALGAGLTTWYWRIRTRPPSGGSFQNPSRTHNFQVDTARGAPYTDTNFAGWYQSLVDQLNYSTLENATALAFAFPDPDRVEIAAGQTRGVYTTPPISLYAQDIRGDRSINNWHQVVIKAHHNDAAAVTKITFEVFAIEGQRHRLLQRAVSQSSGSAELAVTQPLEAILADPKEPGVGQAGAPLVFVKVTLERPLTTTASPYVHEIRVQGEILTSTTAVTMTNVTATPHDGEVLLTWQTGAERNNLGFNVYRSESPDGDYALISTGLVVGLGDDAAGGAYYFLDQTAQNGKTYHYRIEDVEAGGRVSLHAPASVTPLVGLGAAVVNPALFVNGQTNDGSAGQSTGTAANADRSASSEYKGTTPGVLITNSGGTGFDLQIDVPRFARGSINAGSPPAAYDAVSIAGYDSSTDLNHPVVPTRNVLIEVPPVLSASLSSIVLLPEASGGYALAANLPSGLGAIPASHDGSTVWPANAIEVNGIIKAGDRTLLSLKVNPIGFISGLGVLTYHPRITARVTYGPPEPGTPGATSAEVAQSTLATANNVLKITVDQDGVYRLTKADLDGAGFDTGTDPRQWALWNQGRTVPMRVLGEGDGSFDGGDTVEFFGQRNTNTFPDSRQTRFSDSNAYWLAVGTGNGPRVPDVDATPSSLAPFSSFTGVVRAEQQALVRRTPYATEGLDHWFSSQLTAGGSSSAAHTLTLWAAAPPLNTALLRYRLRGNTDDEDPTTVDHRVDLELNSVVVGNVQINATDAVSGEIPVTVLPGANDVTVRVLGSAANKVLVDWVELRYPRRFLSESRTSLRFQHGLSGTHRVENLASNDAEVWDVTDPANPRRLINGALLDTNVVVGAGGALSAGPSWQVTFDTFGDVQPAAQRDVLVLTGAGKRTPASIALHTPTQSLRLGLLGADYIVITDRSLSAAATRLAAYRQGRGLRAQVVYVDEIMDEFAFGNLDPEAITRFLKHAYESWALPRPKYVCLLGDGHYDYHDHIGSGAPNLVPPRMVETEFFWCASDNRFATVSGNDVVPDLKIGRLPVNSLAAATKLLDKIEAYEALPFDATWGEHVLFVADDPDHVFDFPASADEVAAKVPAGYTQTKAYFPSSGSAATVRQLIKDTINNPGAFLTFYSGHGSLTVWADEDLFSSYRVTSWAPLTVENDVDALTNVGRPTIGIVANCQSGDFSHTNQTLTTMGESWVRHDGGGAVAFWASTGFTRPAAQHIMTKHLFDILFPENVGVLGDAVDEAKLRLATSGSYEDIVDTWSLLGDPALTIYSKNPQLAQPNPMPSTPPGPTPFLPPPGPLPPTAVPPPESFPDPNPGDGTFKLFGAGCALLAEEQSPAPAGLPLALLLLLLAGLRLRRTH